MATASRKTTAHRMGHLSIKLVASILLLVCLAAGLAGLILPLIPGFLFLVLAAIIAARHFPGAQRWARKSARLGRFLDDANRLSRVSMARLTLGQRVGLGALLCAKTLVDGIALIGGATAKLTRYGAALARRAGAAGTQATTRRY